MEVIVRGSPEEIGALLDLIRSGAPAGDDVPEIVIHGFCAETGEEGEIYDP